MRRCLVAALAALSLSSFVHATTVIAPSFEALVAQADVVFESEVIDARSHLDAGRDGSAIVTDVYFHVEKILKGSAPSTLVLQFLGGEVGDVGYRVDGVPRFVKGDRDVLFARTAPQLASPLVGMMHGRVRIAGSRGASQEFVQQFDRSPLRDVAALGVEAPQPALSPRPAMSLRAFESAIVGEVARQQAERRDRR
jgi:hypothetical protein